MDRSYYISGRRDSGRGLDRQKVFTVKTGLLMRRDLYV